jgi:MFS family permease
MLKKFRATIEEFPKYWILASAAFVDRVGGTMIFPFFALYITKRFNVGMTQAGMLLGVFSISGFLGSIWATLADRFGRKKIVIIGLVFNAETIDRSANELWIFMSWRSGWDAFGIAGRLASVVADVPEEKRTKALV